MLIVEVCIETADDARAAASGGADRLELCRDLSSGGLTPNPEVVREVVAATLRPVVAMLRCRPGNFLYSESELTGMEQDVLLLLEAGASGIVFGAVDDTGMPHLSAVRRIRAAIDAAVGKDQRAELVFHRAFDEVPDQPSALERLIDLGVDRVLTSGHPEGVAAGLDRLAELITLAGERITVMPGGGIRADNIAELMRRTGAREIHFSARAQASDPTDAERVRELASLAQRYSLDSAPYPGGLAVLLLLHFFAACSVLLGIGSGGYYTRYTYLGEDGGLLCESESGWKLNSWVAFFFAIAATFWWMAHRVAKRRVG